MTPVLPLNERTLTHHAARVAVPTYDRRALGRGVVHISVGSFHRAHQAAYFDALARRGLADGWALTGVGLRRPEMRDVLAEQDGLYTLLTRGPAGDQARVIGIVTRYLFAPEQQHDVLRALVDPATRLVTLTITANGYLSGCGDPEPSAPTLIALALGRRRQLGLPPFTVLSCDNLPENGSVARAAVLDAAAQLDPSSAEWISDHAAFPSCMVDRITPGTSETDRRWLEQHFGVRDRWPVVTEPFSEWVIEDRFSAGRPPLEAVGVRFVDDVAPFSTTKTRLLNGSHCALGFLGSQAGHACVSDAMGDPLIETYLRHLMDDEIAPLLPRPYSEVTRYGVQVRERLANPALGDPLSRLCRNGSMKVPGHLLTSILDARRAGREHPLLTLAVAAWCRYLRGDRAGVSPAIDDPEGERLGRLAREQPGDPRPLLADRQTFGSLGRCPRFAAAVTRDLRALDTSGVRATIARRVLREQLPVADAA